MNQHESGPTAADSIYAQFFATLQASGTEGQHLARELQTLRDVGEMGRETALIEAIQRVVRDSR